MKQTSTVDEQTGITIELIDPVYPKNPKRQHTLLIHKDDSGHIEGYSMYLVNSVCLDDKCKQVEVTMFWDDAGNYVRLEYPEKNPLTRVEHEHFTAEDYKRLDEILKDKKSVLQEHSLAYLAKEPDKPKAKKKADDIDDLDGIATATPASVQAAVVKDAAWTSWVLWTYANTEIVPILQAETIAHCTPAYIEKTLNSKDWLKIQFILNYLLKEKIYSKDYATAVTTVLAKADIDQIDLGLTYLKRASENKNDYYKSIIQALPELGNYSAAKVIDELAKEEQLDEEMLLLLTETLNKLSYYAVNLSLRLIENKNLFSSKIEANISRLLDVQNFFIARRGYTFLRDQELSPETIKKRDAFAKKYKDRL